MYVTTITSNTKQGHPAMNSGDEAESLMKVIVSNMQCAVDQRQIPGTVSLPNIPAYAPGMANLAVADCNKEILGKVSDNYTLLLCVFMCLMVRFFAQRFVFALFDVLHQVGAIKVLQQSLLSEKAQIPTTQVRRPPHTHTHILFVAMCLGILGFKTTIQMHHNSLDSTKQVWLLKAMWQLAFVDSHIPMITSDPKYMRVVRDLAQGKNNFSDFEVTAQIKKSASGLLWEIEPKKIQSQTEPAKDDSKHVMISYCWDNQTIVLQVAKSLESQGIKVWLDVSEMQV